jgi:hypothetical protein
MSLRRRFPFTPLAHNVHYSKLRINVHYCTNLNNVHYAKVMFTFRLSIVYARFLVTPFTLTHYVLVETKSTCYLSIYLSILVTAIYLPAHLPLQYPYMLCTGLKNNTKYKIPARPPLPFISKTLKPSLLLSIGSLMSAWLGVDVDVDLVLRLQNCSLATFWALADFCRM